MRPLIFTFLFCCVAHLSSLAQTISEDSYCVKLKRPVRAGYFEKVDRSLLSNELQNTYGIRLDGIATLLSRFGEMPLKDSTADVFRMISMVGFDDLTKTTIIRIEKDEGKVLLTIKAIDTIKDSTFFVYKKVVSMEVWKKFESLAEQYFLAQPSFKEYEVHDGSTTVYEGYLRGQYHFLMRRVIAISDPGLQEIERYLFRSVGDFYGADCKDNWREN